MGAIDQAIRDLILMNAIDLTRLEAHERQKVIDILKRLEKDLSELLASEVVSSLGRSAVNLILSDARAIIKESYIEAQAIAQVTATGLVELESKFIVDVMQQTLNIAVSEGTAITAGHAKVLATNALIDGSPAAQWWSRQAGDVAFRFAAEVRKGVAASETNQQIISRIVGTETTPGVMPIARKNAATLVQTSVQTVANESRMATFKEFDDVIEAYYFLATLDSHTCPQCAAYSGMEWDTNEQPINGNTLPFVNPPLHMNCRCLINVRTKKIEGMPRLSDDPHRMRASSLGPVPMSFTFDDYFKSRSVNDQNEQFGKGRAELYRQGKITLRDMLDQSGNKLSLEQLIAKYGKK